MAGTLLRSSRHDYQYYPKSWYDETTGTNYQAGYYDENGEYYKNVAIKSGNEYETQLACDYCGTQIKLKWKEGAIPSCPNCGALLHTVLEDAIIEDKLKDQVVTTSTGNNGGFDRLLKTVGISLVVLPILFVGTMGVCAKLLDDRIENSTKIAASSMAAEESEVAEGRIYVDVLDRECEWDDEYECYYDEVTDCYFVFEDEADPPEWHYWYEGISSDYGDYGWMAYHYDEDLWYIETSNGHWEVLPDTYDTGSLWHMYEMGTGKFEGQNEYYVESIDRTCSWIPDEASYYDPDTDCYFYYNDYVEPPIWQYWYGGISDQYGDYGIMEYDFDEECWYIETQDGWIELPEEYSTDNLWYIE